MIFIKANCFTSIKNVAIPAFYVHDFIHCAAYRNNNMLSDLSICYLSITYALAEKLSRQYLGQSSP